MGVALVLVMGLLFYYLSSQRVLDLPMECEENKETTCKMKCDDAIEEIADNSVCKNQSLVCCQRKLYPLN
nr:hypothetical protein [uncultured archaeon]